MTSPPRPGAVRPWLLACLAAGAFAAAGTLLLLRRGPDEPPPPVAPPEVAEPAEDITEQVHQFCGACHAYPPADTFPRSAWEDEVRRGYRFFEYSNLRMRPPPLEQVIRYYQDRAPTELTLPDLPCARTPFPARFTRVGHPDPLGGSRAWVSNVNLVHLTDPDRPEILACDMYRGLVMLLKPSDPSPAWKVLARVPHPAHAEVVDLDGDGIKDILVADLGSYPPTDKRCGQVVWLRGRPDGTYQPVTLLKGVGRVADVQAGDFRRCGKLDLVVAAFGWQTTGEVLYLENRTVDWDHPRFVPRVLDGRHGAIHVPVVDLDGDGNLDFVALISQEHEAVVAFLGDGKGHFRKRTLYTAPHPGYGSSGIQLVDLNGDGQVDVLYTNGDTLDSPFLLKPYHSVQWLENQGPDKPFEHHHLATMYGVHRAVAADLDGNGDLDIVCVSFLPGDRFPQRKEKACDAVVVLEQTSPGKFVRHALERVSCDHVTCVAGDLYGSGRVDFVVGNFGSAKWDHPVTIWRNEGRRGRADLGGAFRPRQVRLGK
jgi:hypothetical protein